MKHQTLLLLIALSILPGIAPAADDAGAKAEVRLRQVYDRHGGQQQAREQLQAVAETKLRTCRICHGNNGNSTRSLLPSLAGERAEYLLQRWYELVAGQGESTTASRMAKRINEEQMIALALHFSAQQRQPVDFDELLANNGKAVYRTECEQCHLADGRGNGNMPIIALQQPEYMNRTLLQYRDKNGWRHQSNMAEAPTELTPMQIKASVNYAASLGQ